MKTIQTMCARDCYDSCFVTAAVDDNGKLISVKGDKEHPITRGFTCPRGGRDPFRVYNNRILYPHVRTGKKPGREFRRVEWKEALEKVARQLFGTLKQHGRDQALLLSYAGNTGLLSSKFPQRLWNALGTARTDGALCSAAGIKALSLHYGHAYGLQPDDLPQKDLVVFWGFNATVSAPHLWALALEAREKRNAPVIVIDPRVNETSRKADIHIQPRPGTDIALAMGICRHLIEKEKIKEDFIRKYTLGFERLKAEALTWTPQLVELETGVPWAEIEKIADAYADAEQSATMIGIGMQKTYMGADQVRAVSFIPAILGLDRSFIYSNNQAFFIDTNYISGKEFVNFPVKRVPQVSVGPLAAEGLFKFLFVYGMNPLLSLPDQAALRAGLTREDTFTVVHDTHWTETADYADVVLPAPTHFEKQDLVVSWIHRYCRLLPRVIEPLGESKDEVWVMDRLSRLLGLKLPWLYEDPWKALEHAFRDAFRTGNFGDLLEGKCMTLKCKSPVRYDTPSGKLEFFPEGAAEQGFTPFPQYRPLEQKDGEFVLLNSAMRNYTHSQFRESFGPLPEKVIMYSGDARKLGLEAFDKVKLTNDRGSLTVTLEISSSLPSGVLWTPRPVLDAGGQSTNHLTSAVPQAGSGPTFNSTLVRVEKVETG